MIIVRALVNFVFALGCLFMLVAIASAWLYFIAVAAVEVHWVLALALFVASFFLAKRFPEHLGAPWHMWLAVWTHMDNWLVDLESHRHHLAG